MCKHAIVKIFFSGFIFFFWHPNLSANELTKLNILGEKLIYEGSYQGKYSLNQKLIVAHIVFSTNKNPVQLPNGQLGLDSQLSISTKHSRFAEAIYPLLFRFRSLYQLSPRRLWLLEKYKKRRKKKRQAVFYADGTGSIVRYRADKLRFENPLLPKPIQQWLGRDTPFRLYSQNKLPIDKHALDQMALINYIRQQSLKKNQCLKLPATSGKIQLNYTICGEGQEKINIMGRSKMTTKIKFNATEREKGKMIASHKTIHVWFSVDKFHHPVKFLLRDDTGLYQANLVSINP